MYTQVLAVLRCPTCRGELAPEIHEVEASGEVLSATLTCTRCAVAYPIHHGIADFLGEPRPTTPAQRVNEWALTAWAYERLWRPFALTLLSRSRFPYRRELPLIAHYVQPEHGGLYLDVACSNGLYARALARAMGQANGHVAAIDHSLPMLLEARRRAREANLRISFVRAEAQALPFGANTTSGIVVGGSLNEIGDLDQCIEEVRRVLNPDGRFVAMTLVQSGGRVGRTIQRALAVGGVRFWPPGKLIAIFERCGLRTSWSEQHGLVLFTQSIENSFSEGTLHDV